jgi:glyoxylase-like metal-dependent hydrolase (beta-lactamase superfamily II)
MDGMTRGLRGRLTSHCLLVETPSSLVLIDTGYGLRDVALPRSRLNPLFLSLMRPELREEMTAYRQIQSLGFDPYDVRHVVLSHLDFDHAGGLDDFPQASVHLLATEVSAAVAQTTVLDRMRYRPQQWGTSPNWRTYTPAAGESWRGFSCVRALGGLPPEILLVPLIGHTLGHAGVVIDRGAGWLFYAADAYFYHAEMQRVPECTPGLRVYQRVMEKDRTQRLMNQQRLRDLHAMSEDLTLFCAHDVREFERASGRSLLEPALPSSPPLAAQ